jgi:hypothetical protein
VEAVEPNLVAATAILLVRVYHTPAVPASDVHAAQVQAAVVLRHAGVPVKWLDCASAAAGTAFVVRCDEPVRRSEIVLRIVAAAPGAGTVRHVALGDARVDEQAAEPPLFATVYADRVGATARAAGVSREAVMGRAIAHEIGHLLLNSARHADRGVMRAHWTQAELRRDAPDDWVFLPNDAAAMRTAVTARTSVKRKEG